MKRLFRRWWLRFRIWEVEHLLEDCERWLEQTAQTLPRIRAQLDALRTDARLNEVAGERRYRAMSKFDGRNRV